MGRIRGENPYERRISQVKDPKKVYLLACEGRHTERKYFEGVKDKKSQLNIVDYIEIEIFKKSHPDLSNPLKILDELRGIADSKGIDANEICLVVDRDPGSFTDSQYEEVVGKCEKEGYSLYLSNPNFEIWLLFHFLIEKLTLNDVEAFLKDSREVEKMLQAFLIEKGYSRKQSFNKKILFLHYIEEVRKAIDNAKLYKTETSELKDGLGSSVYKLLEDMMEQ